MGRRDGRTSAKRSDPRDTCVRPPLLTAGFGRSRRQGEEADECVEKSSTALPEVPARLPGAVLQLAVTPAEAPAEALRALVSVRWQRSFFAAGRRALILATRALGD